MHKSFIAFPALLLAGLQTSPIVAQAPLTPPRALLPIDFVNSAEAGWLKKPVLASRVLDDMTRANTWKMTGTGTITFPETPRLGDMRALRIDMQMFRDAPAPNRQRLSAINLQRAFPNEDWTQYNRLSFWIKPDFSGVPVMPLQIVLHNNGKEKVPDRLGREGTHYITLMKNGWQQIVWEIEPLARDRITHIEIGYWVNKMFAGPNDHVAFELARLELQRVDPDVHTGWNVAADRIAFSHSGYQPGRSKTAVVGESADGNGKFELQRVSDVAFGETVLRKPIASVTGPQGALRVLDFSEINEPGSYVLRVGNKTSKPFRIGDDAWKASIWKSLNFFYGNRCGYDVPGVHGIDHLDWLATSGDKRMTMSGGWHDAGDLSQGVINTGEGTYAMFSLAERLMQVDNDPALVERLIEEAKWGLDWVLRVRFAGGNRIGFGSHNTWTNNIIGDADDRTVEAKNNPNANYIAAAAAAIGYRMLKARDPVLAARSLAIARDDWNYAIVGIEGPSTWHTPAFAASRMELAGIGITASLELYRSTGEAKYRDKAVELARVVMGSQQVARVGSKFPLSGFFYTGPDRDTLFHQFHRAADQSGVVAMSQLVEALPDHPDWIKWYATAVRYAEYQKKSATITAPYSVLPAYVYRVVDSVQVPDSGGRYMEKQSEYADQVRSGTVMGEGWYLRTFPVWFQRRGNYGVLLSQAKGLSAVSRLRGDSTGLDLAEKQAQWVVGRNPFAQSTMYGEGYDWAQQYSVSSSDFVGSLPVGMQSRGVTDLPYWPSQNMYVYKEVWVHSNIRWLWLIEDLLHTAKTDETSRGDGVTLENTAAANGDITVRATVRGAGAHTYALRVENLVVRSAPTSLTTTLRDGVAATFEWKVRRTDPNAPFIAVLMEDGVRRKDLYRD